jgi:hypothetical protein
MLRVVEIESESSGSDEDLSPTDDFSAPTCTSPERENRVSFRNNSKPHNHITKTRARSPPPNEDAQLEDSGSESSDEEYVYDDEEEEDNELGLRRFGSAAAKPPRMIEDEEGSSDDEDEPRSPPTIPEAELKEIMGQEDDEELVGLYQGLQKCSCHGHHKDGPVVEKAWEVPEKEGFHGKRLAVVQVVQVTT